MEFLEGIRHVDWTTAVIVISEFADAALIKAARLLGATAVLAKPFALQDFLDAVHKVAPPRQS